MFVVIDLDSRHRFQTFSTKIASEAWNAILESGGTPFMTHRENGVTLVVRLPVHA